MFHVAATTVKAGIDEVTAGFSLDPTEFHERFRPRVEEVHLAGANSEDEKEGRRGAIQRFLAATRRRIASINHNLHLLRGGGGNGSLTPSQLAWLRGSAWGRSNKGRDMIRRAVDDADPVAINQLRRRLARTRCNLRRVRRRKYRQARTKVDHLWRSAETWLAGTAHAGFLGAIPRNVLKLRKGRKESDQRPTKWILQQARVIGAPARFKRFGEELAQGWVRLGPDGPTYGMGCASYEPTWESFSTALCPSCKRLLKVGSKVSPRGAGRGSGGRGSLTSRAKEIFACPCGWTESRDGGAARLIMLSGMQGVDFDVNEARRRQQDGGEEYEYTKEADLDGDIDGGGDEGGAEGANAAGAGEDAGGDGEGGEAGEGADPAGQGQEVRPAACRPHPRPTGDLTHPAPGGGQAPAGGRR